jgi:hypothetical protein
VDADSAAALYAACDDGDCVLVEIVTSKPRSIAQHRLYWALCAIVSENHEDLPSAEAASDCIKIAAGHFESCAVALPDGERLWIQRPKSISFAAMGQEEFAAFFSAALDVICSALLPGLDVGELRKEAYLRTGVPEASSA